MLVETNNHILDINFENPFEINVSNNSIQYDILYRRIELYMKYCDEKYSLITCLVPAENEKDIDMLCNLFTYIAHSMISTIFSQFKNNNANVALISLMDLSEQILKDKLKEDNATEDADTLQKWYLLNMDKEKESLIKGGTCNG